jgi:hypothetical protein
VGAQNAQNWTASIVIGIEPKPAQNGGSARGYQGLSVRLAISTTAEQAGGPGRMFMHGQRWA